MPLCLTFSAAGPFGSIEVSERGKGRHMADVGRQQMNRTLIAVLAVSAMVRACNGQMAYDFAPPIAVRVDAETTSLVYRVGYAHRLWPATWADVTNKCRKLARYETRIILLKGTNISDRTALDTAKTIKSFGFAHVPVLCQVGTQSNGEGTLYTELNGTTTQTIYALQLKWMEEDKNAQPAH